MENWRWILLLLLAILPALFECFAPEVDTKTGRIRGIRELYNGYCMDVFYGIPYAEPPVGELRFQRTVPVMKWTGTLNATTKPPACSQVPSDFVNEDAPQSEDCLYLNIWAPCNVTNKKAVMLWIHGGNFTHGSASMSMYDGSELVEKGDIVVVAINYRLGVFGFLFAGTEDASGNAGMYDQVEAITWVHDNIGAFGGNSSCITLFGESAGSISISMHNLSPLTKHLYHRVIMQSGSAALLLTAITPALNFKSTNDLAKSVDCSSREVNITTDPKAVMDCLRNVDTKTLIEHSVDYHFGPQYGDSFLPDDPRAAIINGNSRNCDRLMGVTADEGSLFWVARYVYEYGKYGEKIQHPRLNKSRAYSMIAETIQGYGVPPVASELVAEYYLNKAIGDDNEEVLRQSYTAAGDCAMLCPTVYEAERAAQQGNRVYFYKFAHRPSFIYTGEWMGVFHFSEVPFVFGMPLRSCESENQVYCVQAESYLSWRMIKMWTDFAKTGSPDYDATSWPYYSREHPEYAILNITGSLEIGNGPNRDNCEFLRELYGFA